MLRALIALSSSRNRRHHHYRRDLPSSLVRPPSLPPFLSSTDRPRLQPPPTFVADNILVRNLSALGADLPLIYIRAAENRGWEINTIRFPQPADSTRNFASNFVSKEPN